MLVDLAGVDPYDLRELADLLIEKERHRAEKRTAQLAELYEAPALGSFRKPRATGWPDPPPGYRWSRRGYLEVLE